MEAPIRKIREYYDTQPEREWERMDRHRTEFAVTLRALSAHLPPPPVRVLDCGGGPGRYAIELARLGYRVTLFDLSEGNLLLAKTKAAEAGVVLESIELGTAIDLGRFPDESFDSVLLMGPLYHLLEADERRQALEEARRVLKPGGPLFAAFISRYSGHRYWAREAPEYILQNAPMFESVLTTGILPPRSEIPEFVAYLAHPSEVAPLCRGAGLEVRTVLGVEGLVSGNEGRINLFTDEVWQRWVELNFRVAPDPFIHGAVEHLLAVCVRPGWRAALRSVAGKLNAAGIPFKVVGGTSIVLQGVVLPVKDIDLEMEPEDAYRFGELFAEQTLLPVAWREGEQYRSHFGRFEIHGIQFEVMGDLQRREGEAWVATAALTRHNLILEGVPIPISWLEEETLGYIRRGRMERAARCIELCDSERMRQVMNLNYS